MITVGLLLAVLCAACKAVDTLINKDVMQQQSVINHIFYRIIFATPILLVAALMNWKLEPGVFWYMILYGVLEAVNIFCHQFAVKKSDPLHIEIISKSKVIFVLILSFLLSIDTLTFWSTMGIAVFMIGVVLTINFQNRTGGDVTGWKGIVLEILSVLARTFKPFVLKVCVQRSLSTSETMAFLSMIVAFAVLFAIFRPKLDFKGVDVKKYGGQAAVVAVSMLLSGWAVRYANAVIVNAIESTTVIFVMIISAIAYRKKYPALMIIGSIISIIGIVLAIVL